MKRQFLMIPENDKDISRVVGLAFGEARSTVCLVELRKRMMDRFRYDPTQIVEFEQDELRLCNENHQSMAKFYPITDGQISPNNFYWI